jgi:hypothetical protein
MNRGLIALIALLAHFLKTAAKLAAEFGASVNPTHGPGNCLTARQVNYARNRQKIVNIRNEISLGVDILWLVLAALCSRAP